MNANYITKLKLEERRSLLAGLLGIFYSLGLIIISFTHDSGIINFGVPLYILLALPVTIIIWFVGEIFERFYWLAQLLTLAGVVWGTWSLWTYPV